LPTGPFDRATAGSLWGEITQRLARNGGHFDAAAVPEFGHQPKLTLAARTSLPGDQHPPFFHTAIRRYPTTKPIASTGTRIGLANDAVSRRLSDQL